MRLHDRLSRHHTRRDRHHGSPRRLHALALLALASCARSASTSPDAATPVVDATAPLVDVPIAPLDGPFAADGAVGDPPSACDLPTRPGTWCALGADVPGAGVPCGFCLRRYATVPEARSLAVAPNGDVLVASPSEPTAGGASGGLGAIVVLADDDHNGVAEVSTFAGRLADVQGLALGGGHVWFTTMNAVYRTPYTAGQRIEAPSVRQSVADYTAPPAMRSTHGMAVSASGAVYTSLGEYLSACGDMSSGAVLRVEGGSLATVARGLANPMYVRCHPRDEVCVASELSDDGAGRWDKVVVLRDGDDFGWPCCRDHGIAGLRSPDAGCDDARRADSVLPEDASPFGLDWERGAWPAPYTGALFVALHGSFYSTPLGQGAGIAFAQTDPATHAPVGGWRYFVTGFQAWRAALQRPADVAFAADGRMFFADDMGGAVYWVAPLDLAVPTH